MSCFALLLCVVGLTGCSLPRVTAEDRLFLPLSIEFLGSYTLTDKEFKNTTVGGLSGITYDRKRDLYYAISDDRSDRDPARFYTLKLQIDQNALKSVEVQNVTTLVDENGQPFAKGTIDPEGIALSPLNSVFISSEGDVKDEVAPFIGEFDLQTGKLKRKLTIPETYLPDAKMIGQTRGVQDNRAFESLTLNAGASTAPPAEPFRLFTVVESPLVQDLELPNTKESLLNRLLHYQIWDSRSTIISEHAYPLDPKPTGAIDHGLSEFLSIDQGGHFLSLERSFGLTGFRIKLFQVTTGTASDISTFGTLRNAQMKPAAKELLLDLNQLGTRLDNLEGMTIGARFPDGSHSLVMVSDDNFAKLGQITQVLLFKLKGLKG
ncbi:esterase-like activity of phytase family protein [Pseudanabaenaceae cyanobacterium LEGE 13415]|nr:esterase-like activity of phytase family protein [Pseudanabaenaceae cyanobacterium LEGE 13415]